MTKRIPATDYSKLRELAKQHGAPVSFTYTDAQGKRTTPTTTVDATTVRNDSILTYSDKEGYKRYRFDRLDSAVETD